jgi:hypothetical protein
MKPILQEQTEVTEEEAGMGMNGKGIKTERIFFVLHFLCYLLFKNSFIRFSTLRLRIFAVLSHGIDPF